MTGRTRRARFERESVLPLQITKRDRAILQVVARHRLLTSRHIAVLAGGSAARILRRLQLLFHHGYLDRPRAQIEWYVAGSNPMVYALGRKGAKEIGRGASRWTQKNRELGRGFLRHTLAVADSLVQMELWCRDQPGVEYIPEEQLRANLGRKLRLGEHPFRITVSVSFKGRRERVGVIPDALFALRYRGRPPGRDTNYFFLEVDRGTMPIARKDLRHTSILRKLLVYREAWKQKLDSHRFEFPNFRVLVVMPSEERRGNLVMLFRTSFRTCHGLFILHADPVKTFALIEPP